MINYCFLIMTDSMFYSFAGDTNTYIGAVALFATPVILYWIFRSFYNSPYNVSVKVNREDKED